MGRTQESEEEERNQRIAQDEQNIPSDYAEYLEMEREIRGE